MWLVLLYSPTDDKYIPLALCKDREAASIVGDAVASLTTRHKIKMGPLSAFDLSTNDWLGPLDAAMKALKGR